METVRITSEAVVEITPRLMAEAFYHMDDYQQAQFFEELHSVATEDYENGNTRMYSLGEAQWCYMAGAMSDKAKEMYMALSSFAYRWWPQRSLSEFPKAVPSQLREAMVGGE